MDRILEYQNTRLDWCSQLVIYGRIIAILQLSLTDNFLLTDKNGLITHLFGDFVDVNHKAVFSFVLLLAHLDSHELVV